MKKAIISLILLYSVHSYAAGSPNGLSATASVGYNSSGMGMYEIINKRGIVGDFGTGTYQSVYSPGGGGGGIQVVVPSITKIRTTDLNSSETQYGGSEMYSSTEIDNTYFHGTSLSAGLKFTFFNFLFIKSEFTYDTNEYQPIRTAVEFNFPINPGYMPQYGETAEFFFHYDYMAIPVIIGLNLPISYKNRYKGDIYLGAGAVFTRYTYFININAPSGYFNDSGTPFGGIEETLEFTTETIGYTWIIGGDYALSASLNLFFEVTSVILPEQYGESDYSDSSMETALSGKLFTEMDASHTIIKMGVSYKVSDLIMGLFY